MKSKVDNAFVKLLQDQVKFLRDDDYAYAALQVYLEGDPEPYEFSSEDEFEFDVAQGTLVVRDGPVEENENEEVPEYVLRLDKVVASVLS